MALPTPGTIPLCIRIAIEAEQYGDERVNVLHAAFPDAFTPSDMSNAVSAVIAAYTSNYKGIQHTSVLGVGVTAISLDPTLPYNAFGSLVALDGTVASPALPGNVCASITGRTGLRGRTRHGALRTFGLTTDALTSSGTLTTSYQASCISLMAAFKSALLAAGWTVGVGSYAGHYLTGYTSFDVNPWPDSQKTRLPQHGA